MPTYIKHRNWSNKAAYEKSLFRITLTLAALSLLLGTAIAAPEQDAKEPFEQGVAALTQGNPTLAVEKFTRP